MLVVSLESLMDFYQSSAESLSWNVVNLILMASSTTLSSLRHFFICSIHFSANIGSLSPEQVGGWRRQKSAMIDINILDGCCGSGGSGGDCGVWFCYNCVITNKRSSIVSGRGVAAGATPGSSWSSSTSRSMICQNTNQIFLTKLLE